MASHDEKRPSSDIHSFDAPPSDIHPAHRQKSSLISSITLGLTVLALCSAITIVGTSADTLYVYNNTRLGSGHFLSIWPGEFDIKPSVALVVCGSIMVLSSIFSILALKTPFISNHALLSLPISLLFPVVSLIAALISISFFYVQNTSTTTYSLQSWTCQWQDVEMNTKPYWGTLCRESKAALYLSIAMVPLQIIVLGAVVVGFLGRVRGWIGGEIHGERREEGKTSPALS